jgi:hypothetical protein
MSDLPEAREAELERFAESLFPFVGLWMLWVNIYAGHADYYGAKAAALEAAGTDPERVMEYRRRQDLYATWATSVGEIAASANTLAAIVAEALGGTVESGVFAIRATTPRQ